MYHSVASLTWHWRSGRQALHQSSRRLRWCWFALLCFGQLSSGHPHIAAVEAIAIPIAIVSSRTRSTGSWPTHILHTSTPTTMIRRAPTAITVTSNDVAELKAQREAVRAGREAGAANPGEDGSETRDNADVEMAGTSSNFQQQEHPADRAARERRQGTAAERIGL